MIHRGTRIVRDPILVASRELAFEQLFEASTEDLLATFALSGYAPHPAIQFKVAV